MSNRQDIVQNISRKLETISPSDAQTLACAIANLHWPYKTINVKGSNINNQTTKGWPDAIATRADGTTYAIEATREKNWDGHIRNDLEKAKQQRVDKLLFIATSSKNISHDIWVKEFAAAGISLEIISGMGLIELLARQEYALLRKNILGLPIGPSIFNLIKPDREASPYRKDIFRPKPEEYRNKLVHRPALTDEIEKLLDQDKCALIRGRGAAGKTILAHLIACGDIQRDYPCFYLDIASYTNILTERSRIKEDIANFAGKNVLFILDNIHIDEETAEEIFKYWQNYCRFHGTRLLLIGREINDGLSNNNVLPSPRILRADISDLEGVFLRLAKKTKNVTIPTPPEEILRQWAKVFGGNRPDSPIDLLAFSAAVDNKLSKLLNLNWKLEHKDASDAVLKHYLRPLNENERKNLLRLACLPEDMLLPQECLEDIFSGLEKSIQKGIVFVTNIADKTAYRLAHPALGELLQSAVPLSPSDRIKELHAIAEKSTLIAFALARRMLNENRTNYGQEFIELALKDSNWPACFSNLASFRIYIGVARKLAPNTLQTIERGIIDYIRTSPSALNQLVMNSDLHSLVAFLRYTSSNMGELYSTFAPQLNQTTEYSRWLDNDLNNINTFLDFISRGETFSELRKNFLTYINNEENQEKLINNINNSNLLFLVKFVEYAKNQKDIKNLYNKLIEHLNQTTEYSRWLDNDLNNINTFLDFISRGETFSELRKNFLTYINNEENQEKLINKAINTDLNFLKVFLEYISGRNELSALHDNFFQHLNQTKNQQEFINKAINTDRNFLTGFLRYAKNKNELKPIYKTILDKQNSPSTT